ncbi:MAG: right-handed parallel beta-helix repeat-containing protein [Magnetococcales bacterium]|nr:right-handed parallel beta-helix repeat-containing protein [Magnetococcales bacterium]
MMIEKSNRVCSYPFIAICGLSLLLLGGCGSTPDKKGKVIPDPNPPMAQEDGKKVSQPQFPKNVAMLPFKNSTKNDEASRAVRRTMFNHFAAKNYYSLHMQEVDRRLGLANLSPSQTMDEKEIKQVADALGVDGLIIGEVTNYDKVFVGVYAQVAVGVKLRFVAKDGRLIWQGEEVIRKHEGGISASPVSMILQVVASAMHIRDINLFRAADEMGREIVNRIPEPKRLSIGLMQNIKRVVHDGTARHLRFGDLLSIAIEGTPGQKAYARVQGLPVVPLTEGEAGFYSGEMAIPADVDMEAVVVTGILEDDQGRRGEKIATTGYLFIDNTPPKPIKNLKVDGRDGQVNLTWQSATDGDIDSFEILSASTAQGPFTTVVSTRDNHFEQKSLENFNDTYYQIVALDKAGNRSKHVSGKGRPVPDPRFDTAQTVPQLLPATLSGVNKLSADGGPYLIQDKVELTEDGVLLIEPNTEIKLTLAGHLMVNGELKIFGDSNKPVKVSGRDGMEFGTFVKLDSNRPVLIKGVEINQGGVPIIISSGKPYIDEVKIVGSSYNAFEIKGASQPVISNSTVKDGQGGVAIISERARPRLENNQFINNGPVHIYCSSPYLIKAPGNSWQQPDISSPAALLKSEGCTFELE